VEIEAVRELFQTLEVREAFRAWGQEGGELRAKRLTAEERREIARKAARARWKNKKS
jgi:hypothetical protein